MKRFVAISFSIFYLLITVGLSVDVHYCSGKIASVGNYAGEGACCGEMAACDSGCCHNETEFIQFEELQYFQPESRLDVEQSVVELAIDFQPVMPDLFTFVTNQFIERYYFPPPKVPIWLRLCSLVYYG